LAEHRPSTIYAFGDPVEAYVSIAPQPTFWVEQSISELVWSSDRGYRSALSFFRQIGMNKTAIAWYEPSDGPFYWSYLDQGVAVRVERAIMFRVHDVARALGGLVPTSSGEFAVEVVDPVAPQVNGVWRVRFRTGEAPVVEPGGEPDFRLDIQAFSQAFMGEPSLQDLLRLGRVTVRNAGPVEDAMRLLSPSPTVCLDFF
jgi:predicted acetyltransferase